MAFIENDDGYVVFEGSDDDEEFDSSDDNDDFFQDIINGSRKKLKKIDSSDFENEMNKELDNTLNALHASHGIVSTLIRPSTSDENSTSSEQPKFYNDVYFDSDSDDNGDVESTTVPSARSRTKKAKHPILSNDDLFYDPDADDDDQKWIDKRRRRCNPIQHHRNEASGSTSKKLPNSDAVLNCPACMTTLCRDCQRHDVYKGQFRAMFVTNCKVDFKRLLRYPKPKTAKKSSVKESMDDAAGAAADVSYNPVHCLVCNTQVAVYDPNEIYHFFNVLTSYN